MVSRQPQEPGEEEGPSEAQAPRSGEGPDTPAPARSGVGHQEAAELRRAQEELAASQARYFDFFDLAPVGYLILDAQGLIQEANQSAAALLGLDRSQAIGQPLIRFLFQADQHTYYLHHKQLSDGTQPVMACELRLQRPDGALCWVLMQSALGQGSDRALACRVTLSDISERKQAEQALADRERRLRTILHLLNTAKDRHGMLRAILELLHGWSGCDAVGIRLREGDDYPYFETSGFPAAFVKKENSLCARDLAGQLLRDSTGHPVLECMCGNVLCGRFDPAQPFFTPYGSFWTNSTTRLLASTTEADRQARTRNRCNTAGFESVALIPLRAGGITYGLLQLNDYRQGRFSPSLIALLERLGESLAISLAQHQAQEALRASEERLRMALAASDQGIFELDLQTMKVTVSEDYAHLLGYETREWLMSDWLESIHPDDRAHAERIIREAIVGGSEKHSAEYRRKTGSGEWRWTLTCGEIVARDETGRPLRIVGTHMDITERKQTEEALRLAQKTESLGVLAGGVAHDFNNLLVAMLGQASLALARLPPESAAREPIQKAVSAAQRAADLTRQMLAYSGRGHFVVAPLCLNALIEENLRLLEVGIPKHVRLAAELAGGLPLIQADAGQVQQVLMNLILNAAEAIGPRPGTVTIRTGFSDITPSDRHIWRHTGEPLPAGRYVVLEVSDNGCGMDAETLPRIFDPFFTTKFTGRGLGLAAVLGIVRGHHGGLRVESTPGAGTTFQLAFPAAAQQEPEPVQPAVAPSAASPARRAADVILLIDDEEAVREAVTDILEMTGVHVLAAADGQAGLALYRENRAAVRLVLLDLSMPGMSGEETFRQLRALDSEVRIILSSGYDEGEVSARFAGQGLTGFVQKPYDVARLTAAIRQHLAAE